jgi:hypothetical protein
MDKDQLLASLLVGNEDIGGVSFEDDGRYCDWSSESENGVCFEVGDMGTGEATAIDVAWSEMERLQRALTLRLLQRGQ